MSKVKFQNGDIKGKCEKEEVKGKILKGKCPRKHVERKRKERRGQRVKGRCYLAGADIGRRTYSIS